MSKIDDAGPAFPTLMATYHTGGAVSLTTGGGMTLRDWLAGQALVAATYYWMSKDTTLTAAEAVDDAVMIADALIARLKGGGA